MEDFLLAPFKIARKKIWLVLVPAVPIILLLASVFAGGARTPDRVLEETDGYLGGTVYLSAANLTAFNEFSTNVQIPVIRLGGIAERTDVRELADGRYAGFLLVFGTLFLGFLSYSVIANSIAGLAGRKGGGAGVNPASVVLSGLAAFLMIFISSFSLGGFKLLLMINFGIFFTFSIPYAAAGEPLGESVFKAFRFLSKNLGRVVAAYIGCMGAAIMVPIGLLLFTTPLILNLDSATVTTLLKLFLGLVAIVFALFYQMSLCATAVFEADRRLSA